MMTPARCAPRPYRGPADLQAMIDLVSRRPLERISGYPFIVDLEETTGTPEGQSTIQLWETPDGALAAFTLLDGSFLTFEIAPNADYEALGEEILAWAVETAGAAGKLGEGLDTGCREEDTRRRGFLTQRGFIEQPVRTLHFSRALGDPVPTPELPEGFSIRPLAGDPEAFQAAAADWIELHHAAHEGSEMTVDFRLAMMRTREYRPELDLVAVAPDGQLAAYVMCHFSEEENRLREKKVGYTDPVATHPDFQRRGLSRALLLAGFQRLKDCGMDFAEVTTWGENEGMIKTAESAGYRVYSTTIFFNRAG